MPSGDFEREFYELCRKNGITSIKVAPRPHRPSSPSVFHPETSMSKGKESKEGKMFAFGQYKKNVYLFY